MRDHFFNTIFNEESSNSFPALSFESRVVRRLFTECGVSPRMGVLVNKCRDETGEPHFSFDWFNSYFSSFPATLSGARIGYCGTRVVSGVREKRNLYQLDLSDIFKPKKNLLIRALVDNVQKKNIDFDAGLFIFVFPVRRKMYCAHNFGQPVFSDSISPDSVDVSLSIFLTGNNMLTIQPTAPVFGYIGSSWYSE
jgi:hypothetical protein